MLSEQKTGSTLLLLFTFLLTLSSPKSQRKKIESNLSRNRHRFFVFFFFFRLLVHFKSSIICFGLKLQLRLSALDKNKE